jgi:hypothetical protein
LPKKPEHKLKEEAMGLNWSTDRRKFLTMGGALFAGIAARPHFAWAADGDTLRLRASSANSTTSFRAARR